MIKDELLFRKRRRIKRKEKIQRRKMEKYFKKNRGRNP